MFKDNFQYPINSISWAICHCPQANVFGTVLQFDLLNWISISDTRSHVIIYLSLVNGLKWTFSPVDIHIFYSERLLCTSNRLKTDRVYFIWIRGNKSLKETVYSSLILYYNGQVRVGFRTTLMGIRHDNRTADFAEFTLLLNKYVRISSLSIL